MSTEEGQGIANIAQSTSEGGVARVFRLLVTGNALEHEQREDNYRFLTVRKKSDEALLMLVGDVVAQEGSPG